MTPPRHVAVIDIGKTNAKLALVDLGSRAEIDVCRTPNNVLPGPPYPHFDTDGLWDFILTGLTSFQAQHGIDAISVTTHGASITLIDAEGGLATPVLDYEFSGPDDLAAAYDPLRPDFADTGSARLPMGLNVGAQIYWLLETQPGLRDRLAQVVTYPQYWVGRLTGTWCNEVTSLGCHTDLWEPRTGRFSGLVDTLGLAANMAPVRRATDRIGPVLPAIASATGLDEGTPVFCGMHDSNASLYPHLLDQPAPFSVLSTGTWVISMAIGGAEVALDPARDALINVNALGAPVPSARFMGGREYEVLTHGVTRQPTQAEVDDVLERRVLVLPSAVPGCGPFPGRTARWTNAPETRSEGERSAAVSLYLGMMAGTCLDMIGARGPSLTEGPFGQNGLFLDMLAAVTDRPVLLPGGSDTGTSIGAALLAAEGGNAGRPAEATPWPGPDPERLAALRDYAADWHDQLTHRKDPTE